MDSETLTFIQHRIHELEHPTRVAISRRFPLLKTPIIGSKRLYRNAKYLLQRISSKRAEEFFPSVIARHSSVLLRRLGESDPKLQQQKIRNLQLAADKLNGLVIPPGKTFSFWKIIGAPTEKRGYVKGMLLSEGKVVEGIGGGLCQMSNLLFWLFLHTPVEITERVHHSFDAFPDSGRVLPFGTGATVYYNLIDLQIENLSGQPIQLKIWLTDLLLKGQIVAPDVEPRKYHVYEKQHCFIKKSGRYYRFNEVWRDEIVGGFSLRSELLFKNLVPVMYAVDEQDLSARNIPLLALP